MCIISLHLLGLKTQQMRSKFQNFPGGEGGMPLDLPKRACFRTLTFCTLRSTVYVALPVPEHSGPSIVARATTQSWLRHCSYALLIRLSGSQHWCQLTWSNEVEQRKSTQRDECRFPSAIAISKQSQVRKCRPPRFYMLTSYTHHSYPLNLRCHLPPLLHAYVLNLAP